MENESQDLYRVVFTPTAQRHFFQVIKFFHQRHDSRRAEQMSDELQAQVPYRGAKEPHLTRRKYNYRYLLFMRTDRAEAKIIYFIDEPNKTVFVTDLIGTEEFPNKISKRNR